MENQLFLFIIILIVLSGFCSDCLGQKKARGPQFFFNIEWGSVGPDIITGELSKPMKSVVHYTVFNTNTSEQSIMDNYEIITKTTSSVGFTTTTSKLLEKITISRLCFGLVLRYQYIQKGNGMIYFVSAIPTYYSFSNSLPSKGEVDKVGDNGIGFVAKAGIDYLLKNNSSFLRLSYSFGTISAIEMSLLLGSRPVHGGGMLHYIQLGVGTRIMDPNLL